MKLIFCFLIIYIGATVNLVNAEEISQPIKNDACWLGQSESGANIGIGQGFIVNKGDRISKFIMHFLPLNFEEHTTDIIICDLRNSEGEVLETSSLKGVDCIKSIEATFNFTEHKNGTYIITCYLHNSKESEYHEYLVYTNKNGSSYTDGTRYVSTGVDPKKWSAWKKAEGDLTFKIPIIAERDSSNKPSQSTRDSNNSSIAESAIDKSMPTDIEKPSLNETWVGAVKENIWIITTIGVIGSIIFFSIMLIYGAGSKDRADRIFKIYGYFKNKTRKSEYTVENTVPHLTDLEYEIYDRFKSVYQKEREEGVSEVNSKTLKLLKHKLLDLTTAGKEINWLDVGCGDGHCLEVLEDIQNRKKIRYHGIDSLHRYLDDAEERARGYGIVATFDKTNAAVMDFDSAYDVVSAVLLLHEVDPLCLPYVLRNMLKALKDDGTLVISDFQGPYEQECDVVAWNVDDITHLLEKIGATWIKIEFIQSKQYPEELGFYRCHIKKPPLVDEGFDELLQGYGDFLTAKKKESKQERNKLRVQIEERVQKLLNRPDIDLKDLSKEEMQRIRTEIEPEYGIKAYKIHLLVSQIEFLDDKIEEFNSGARSVGADQHVS